MPPSFAVLQHLFRAHPDEYSNHFTNADLAALIRRGVKQARLAQWDGGQGTIRLRHLTLIPEAVFLDPDELARTVLTLPSAYAGPTWEPSGPPMEKEEAPSLAGWKEVDHVAVLYAHRRSAELFQSVMAASLQAAAEELPPEAEGPQRLARLRCVTFCPLGAFVKDIIEASAIDLLARCASAFPPAPPGGPMRNAHACPDPSGVTLRLVGYDGGISRVARHLYPKAALPSTVLTAVSLPKEKEQDELYAPQ